MGDLQEPVVQFLLSRGVLESAVGDTVEQREVGRGVFFSGGFSDHICKR